MKIATYWWAGRRHVGQLSADGRNVIPLALGESAHAVGALALVEAMAPSGVGIGFDPPRFLHRGDRVRIEIDGIGTLVNPVQ
ncbi:fumarylacetoacetate hydrolase family protein [Vineibacter terrae]|uniref:fumarylacetoacetate hydrolase family protein n=1 Tax=Vineibacter terrae TaxID=2586908 RepID=UPI0038B63425